VDIEYEFTAIEPRPGLRIFIDGSGSETRRIKGIIDGIAAGYTLESPGINEVVDAVGKDVQFEIYILKIEAERHIFLQAGLGLEGRISDLVHDRTVMHPVGGTFRYVGRSPASCNIRFGVYVLCKRVTAPNAERHPVKPGGKSLEFMEGIGRIGSGRRLGGRIHPMVQAMEGPGIVPDAPA
jgi:hypothetical protein